MLRTTDCAIAAYLTYNGTDIRDSANGHTVNRSVCAWCQPPKSIVTKYNWFVNAKLPYFFISGNGSA